MRNNKKHPLCTKHIKYWTYIWEPTKYNGNSSNILNTGHTYGNLQNTMEIVQIAKRGRCLNSLEKYRIYCIYQENEQINETLTDNTNPILNVTYKHCITK
jgi:hypothetical protein